MPKMKTHSGTKKRVKRTASGKFKRGSAYTSHLAHNQTTKQKRHLAKGGLVSASDQKRLKQVLDQVK